MEENEKFFGASRGNEECLADLDGVLLVDGEVGAGEMAFGFFGDPPLDLIGDLDGGRAWKPVGDRDGDAGRTAGDGDGLGEPYAPIR